MKGDSGTLLPEAWCIPIIGQNLTGPCSDESSEAIDDASPPIFPANDHADQFARLARSSDVEFAVKDGKLTVGDRPLDVPPDIVNPIDLKERIEGQIVRIERSRTGLRTKSPT